MLRSSRTWVVGFAIFGLVLGASCKGPAEKGMEEREAAKAGATASALEEATIADLQEMMTSGKATSISRSLSLRKCGGSSSRVRISSEVSASW